MIDKPLIINRQVRRWTRERNLRNEAQCQNGQDAIPSMQKPVISVSRQRGCRGSEFAKLLANDVHYGCFDRTILDYIARHLGPRCEVVESLDPANRAELNRWIQETFQTRPTDPNDYFYALSETIKAISLQGGVVLLGRGANFILRQTPAFHIRLVAPIEWRVKTLQDFEGKSETDARNEIQRADRERAEFVMQHFNQSIDDPLMYDMVLNMKTHTLDGAIKTVIADLRGRGWKLDSLSTRRAKPTV